MSANIGTAYLTIAPRIDGLDSAVNKAVAGADTARAGEKMGRGLSGGLLNGGAVAGAAAGVVTRAMDAIGDSIGGAVSRVDTLNNFPKVMSSLGYSADEASKAIQGISEHLQGLPSSTDSLAGFAQQIAATGGSLGESTKLALAFNDAMLAGGKGTAAAQGAMYQFAQILSKGKAEGEDWNSLMEAAPGQMNQLATAILGAGHSARDLGEYLGVGVKGAIPTEHIEKFKKALIDLDRQGVSGAASFEEQARSASAGIGTAISNVQTRISTAMANIIDAIGQSSISGAIDAFSSGFSGISAAVVRFIGGFKSALGALDLSGLSSAMQPAADAAQRLSEAAGPAAEALGKLAGEAVVSGMNAVSGAVKSISDAVGPVVEGLGGFSGIAQKVAPVAAALAAVAVPLKAIEAAGVAGGYLAAFTGLAPVAGIIDGVKAAFIGLKGAIDAVKTAQAMLSLMFAANPAGVVLIAIAGVVAALGTLYATNEDFRNAVDSVISAVTGFFADTLVPGVRGAMEAVGALVESAGATIQVAFGAISGAAEALGEGIGSAGAAIRGGFESAVSYISGVPDAIAGFFGGIGDKVGAAFDGVGPRVQAAFASALGYVRAAPARMAACFSGIASRIGGFFSGVKAAITKPFENAYDAVKSIPGKIKNAFSGIRISLPHINLPHISVSGGTPPYGIAGKGSLPRFSIDWYAKGGLFDSPTVLAGVGEAGPEAVLPLKDSVLAGIGRGIADTMGGRGGDVYNITVSARPGDTADDLALRLARAVEARNRLAGRRTAAVDYH